ncbi:MAG TPA: LytTR family DNA-binding domain-containing protein [Bacteroidales bacterium]|nr:LytTR family DNA-binding domain-containing protein [Bacteroidales bacterium]
MLKIAIVEDEPAAIENIQRIIALSKIEINIVGTAQSVQEGVILIRNTNPDLLLLDIELQDGTGFDLLELLHAKSFKLVFVTGSESHALRAFRYSAFDYIVKPINPEELLAVIKQASEVSRVEYLEQQMQVLLKSVGKLTGEPKKLVLRTSETVHVVEIQDIIRCEADRNYTTFYIDTGEKILVSNTLKDYENLLRENGFLRVHNSHLVNLKKIKKYEKLISGCLIMTDNSSVPVSVRKKENLMHYLEQMG